MQISKEVVDGLTVFTVTGEVSAEEIIVQAAEEMADPQTRDSMWDFSQASGVKITTAIVEQIAKRLTVHAANIDGGRVALVGGSNAIHIGLGKMFKAFAALAGLPYEYRVFRNVRAALVWLNSP